MTLNEILLEDYNKKISLKRIYIEKSLYPINSSDKAACFTEKTEFEADNFGLLFGNLSLTDFKTEKIRKESIKISPLKDIFLKGITESDPDTSFIYNIIKKYVKKINSCRRQECENLLMRPPQTFRESLQILWLYILTDTLICELTGAELAHSEQLLYPYLERDIKSGELNQAEFASLVTDFKFKYKFCKYAENANFINLSSGLKNFFDL